MADVKMEANIEDIVGSVPEYLDKVNIEIESHNFLKFSITYKNPFYNIL